MLHLKLQIIFVLHTSLILSIITFNQDNSLYSPSSNENDNLEPFFIDSGKREFVAAFNQTVMFKCYVQNLGDRALSWIRKKDLHILTVGVIRYTKDKRFRTIHRDFQNEWILEISNTEQRDSGIYECQINTEPKLSQIFHLNVSDLEAKIIGSRETYIKSGTNVNLTCLVRSKLNGANRTHLMTNKHAAANGDGGERLHEHRLPSAAVAAAAAASFSVDWFRDDEIIRDWPPDRHGPKFTIEHAAGRETSHLLIANVIENDSGRYTCVPAIGRNDTVVLHVISGEQSAAMQHGISNACRATLSNNFSLFQFISVFFFSFCNIRIFFLTFSANFLMLSIL